MEILEAILLGLTQGLTEFLPISSSGHLFLLERLGIGEPSIFFNLTLHVGTLFAAVWYYRKSLFRLLRRPFGREAMSLVSATAVTGAVAFVYKKFFPEVLNGGMLAAGFFCTAAIIFLSETFGNKKERAAVTPMEKAEAVTPMEKTEAVTPMEKAGAVTEARAPKSTDANMRLKGTTALEERRAKKSGRSNKAPDKNIGAARSGANGVSLVNALICGAAQGIAVLPGLSRSGATIGTLILLGEERGRAADFSFLMSIPVIMAGACAEAAESGAFELDASGIFPIIAGFIAAAVSGYIAVGLFVKLIRKKNMKGFALYAAFLGALCLLIF
ncbi:MAG: undecaprenyl-diphosphate phosphatase [Clostridiales bacterium]|jgi:undecaprenyl-diphosphatase|nr:undecaprenyl-diphosphate phosphatase [Clostridiales bacterium]